MKYFIVIVLLYSCNIHLYCTANFDTPAHFDTVVEKCSADYRLDKNEARKIIANVKINTHTIDEKCMLSCYLKERGFFKNGIINWDRIFITASLFLTNDSEKKKLMEDFQNCNKNLAYGSQNDCEIAYQSMICYENVMKSFNE